MIIAKQEEWLEIVVSNTIHHEEAMVIHSGDALAAHLAVVRPWCLPLMASLAEGIILCLFIDGLILLRDYLHDGTIDEISLFFPDPFPTQPARRLFQTIFLGSFLIGFGISQHLGDLGPKMQLVKRNFTVNADGAER